MNNPIEFIIFFTPLLLTLALVVLFLLAMNWVLLGRVPELGNERRLPRQIIMLGLTLVGAVVVAFALPVSDTLRNQVIGLVGLLLSGVVAFSSTTLVANFMAGIMLRVNRPFRTGDFIRVGSHFGRVSERGLLDTEIQSEHRELIALPNTFLITHPVEVVRSTGAIVSANLSLGYDLHHTRVEALLIAAAKETGLEEPFVQIIELGNYAISYRVSGVLTDVKSLLTTRSNLHRSLLDQLHRDGIEIASPSLVNQRRMADDRQIIPPSVATILQPANLQPEAVIFDKAEEAEQQEQEAQQLETEIQQLQTQAKEASSEDKKRLDELISQKRSLRKQQALADELADEAGDETPLIAMPSPPLNSVADEARLK